MTGTDPPRRRDAPRGPFRPGRAAIGAVVVGALVLGAAALLHGSCDFRIATATYLPVHTLIELTAILAGLAIFLVQTQPTSAAGARDSRALFVGFAFLGVALLDLCHVLAFPGMPGLLAPSSTAQGILYWLAARLLASLALLLAPLISPGRRRALLTPAALLATTIALVTAVVLVGARTSFAARFYDPHAGLTPLKIGLEYGIGAVSLAGAALHLRIFRRTGARVSAAIAVALWLTALSAVCLTLYASAYDGYNLLGHLYKAAAYALIFQALFVEAFVRPYRRLERARREIEASHAELARLRDHIEQELEVTIARLEDRRAAERSAREVAEEALARVAALKEQREELLRSVSHDLRSPLTTIQLQAQRLVRLLGDPATEKPRHAATSIVAACRRMNALIGDLLDEARLDSGNLQLHRQPVAIGSLVEELLAASSGVLDPARVELAIPAGLPPVNADADRLDRVLTNLLSNALKFSPAASRVRVEARAEEGAVAISIADRGAGIPADELPRIFDPYYRARGSGSTDGIGIGLHIARQLVEAHGGRLTVASAPGEGSTFTVKLPAAAAAAG